MKLKRFGRTDLNVTPIGLGLAALGRPGYINLGHADDLNHDYNVQAMAAHAHVVLDAAWAAGVRYFDAARSYGRAENFLGSWLETRSIEPAEVVIGSKWGYVYTAGWQVTAEKHEIKQHTRPILERQIGESRSLLGDHLDLYQIHSATLDSGVLENGEVLAALGGLRDEGLVIGLSLSGPRQADTLRRALDVQIEGRPLFGAVQATWNLLEPSAGVALQEASERGLGVIVKEALANGRLTPRNTNPAFSAQRALLDDVAGQMKTTIDAVALAAVLAQPWADLVLSGAATIEHLRANLGALDICWSEETAARLVALAEPPETYWTIRSNLAWN